ncbi:hypothetical protein MAR_015884 [Mya arenaria]|uniref:Uncharacterized protein n=1 Tax=Mya arenaria TaxID=6604 RepID=A0ABY7FIA2_MYAAR|nr:hypothetical protein MAR_015884 [Mya arenaria]
MRILMVSLDDNNGWSSDRLDCCCQGPILVALVGEPEDGNAVGLFALLCRTVPFISKLLFIILEEQSIKLSPPAEATPGAHRTRLFSASPPTV